MNFNYQRRPTVAVHVGNTTIGGDAPVRVQSMTNTSTRDVEASELQCLSIARAGADLVRLTAQGVREAQCIGQVRERLRRQGCMVPLVADIHFNPQAAIEAAKVTDKVRINPGNFVDPARQFKHFTFTDEEYALELLKVREALIPFIELCREHGTAVRLGVNHGSLSDRIMSRYGNTAAGMVESAMEFLRVFVERDFLNVVISMKASNVVVMVEAVRRLVAAMDAEDMHFPLHLGVTEAGFGEDGRIKSAVGIGALMAQGLGDTIRVSLSEDPELEIPVARKLVDYIARREGHSPIEGLPVNGYDPLAPARRAAVEVAGVAGGRHRPVVVAACRPTQCADMAPDFFFSPAGDVDTTHRFIVPAALWHGQDNVSPLFTVDDFDPTCAAPLKWLLVDTATPLARLEMLRSRVDTVVVLATAHVNVPGSQQAFIHALDRAGIHCPVVLRDCYDTPDDEAFQVMAGADLGAVLLNGLGEGVWLEDRELRPGVAVNTAFAVLQAARLRMSHTEFISCPSCGRTMFDLQTTVQQVKAATSHLTHLKIGVMGCIVNGPGEMADADYGYVGAAVGKISLYKGKTCIEKNIPQEEAIPRLVALIKENGAWRDPLA